ncbi:helix-turn-helix domain-containing protein [Kitasatospora saccharophila]|uniref:Helix-turn-helix domain-containing protein n=2 Tax=Kitasatospora saccharophila TaxID=407973 RepID=A0ABN2WL21_9ACTN
MERMERMDGFEDEEPSGPECFERWREAMGQHRAAEMSSDHVDTFTARMRQFDLGPVALTQTSFPSIRVRRTERMIKREDAELLHLTVLTQGYALAATSAGERAELVGVGDFFLAHSSYPYDTRTLGSPDTPPDRRGVEGLAIDLPSALLPVPAHRLRELMVRKLSGRSGTGALLQEFVVGLGRQADGLQPAEAARLGGVMVDLIGAWLLRELDAEDAQPQEARHRALVESVRAFVRRNLHDPRLAPPVVAAAHHISLSYLHRLFTEYAQGETVAAFIRRQRLERAGRDLADPALRAVPIHAVAARYGMIGASEFTRAFKAAHGLPPREYRQRALAEAAVG